MSRVEILVFRHGETDWNRQRRFQGHTDIPLNDLGREQAENLIPIFNLYKPQVIVSSDLLRAKETAEIANGHLQAPLIVTEALRECRIGDPEGLERDVVFERFGLEAWERWMSTKPEDKDFGFPNGETKSEHLSRMILFIEEFCRRNPELDCIALSTHGGSLRRLVHHCQGAPTSAIAIPNCVLYRLCFDRGAHGSENASSENAWTFHGEP